MKRLIEYAWCLGCELPNDGAAFGLFILLMLSLMLLAGWIGWPRQVVCDCDCHDEDDESVGGSPRDGK
jgi:hypothetical protein